MPSGPRLFIVEDDLITQVQIRGYLENEGYEACGISNSAEKAWNELQSLNPDLVILDINLSGEKDGLWLAARLSELPIPFIFLTADKDKATIREASSLKPNGYLIKPFDEMDLFSAIEVALKNFSSRSSQPTDDGLLVKDSIFVKEDNLLVKVVLSDLIYIMSEGNYLELHTSARKHIIRAKLSEFTATLDSNIFVRVHNRFLINIKMLDSIGTATAKVANKEIPISRAYRDDLLKRISAI